MPGDLWVVGVVDGSAHVDGFDDWSESCEQAIVIAKSVRIYFVEVSYQRQRARPRRLSHRIIVTCPQLDWLRSVVYRLEGSDWGFVLFDQTYRC